jgi:AraC-like DNA-binding protein
VPADLVPFPSALLERLTTLGVDILQVLRDAQIPSSQITPRGRVTTREFFAFWRAAEKTRHAPELGLRLGSEALPHQLDVASLAALHAPSLGEALKKLARYKRLSCPEEISIEIADKEARIRFHWLLAAGEHPPMLLVDATFATVMALGCRGAGRAIAIRRIELTRRPANEPMLRRHFGCEIRFDAPIDLLVLEERALAEPFVTHNEDLLAVMFPGLETALNERGFTRTLVDDVRMAIRHSLHGERPAVERIAKEMRMSARTLQRRLGEAGTTYQTLLDDVRRQSARLLLANTDLDAGEVAFLLGFEELNSFTRAFQAWEGTTPSRWRESAGSQS